MSKIPLMFGWLALAAFGCATSAAMTDDSGTGADDRALCSEPDPGVLDYLDNMEDGDMGVLLRDGRMAEWYTYGDSSGGTLTPAPGMRFTMESIPQPRCGSSRRAMRVTGSGFSDWGIGFGFALKAGMVNGEWVGLPYDAKDARGITFWARVGETSVTSILVMVADQYSAPVGGYCDRTASNGPTACYDYFASTVELTTGWQRYTFRFGELQQRGFGLPRPAVDVAAISSIEFGVTRASSVFDIWIDDVSFFR